MWIAIVGVVALALVAFVAWFFWPQGSRRRDELAQPATRFHWGVIASYRGSADPSQLPQEEARSILGGWSCRDGDALRQKIGLYRSGEINPAFDAARIAWLCELGVSAGWMTLEERTRWSNEALARLRASYAGWQPFVQDLGVGKQRWWAEVARSEMPDQERVRAGEIPGEAAPVIGAIPWGG